MISGSGIFFDGMTSARRAVSVDLMPAALRVRDQNGQVLATWSYGEIEHLTGPDHLLRIGRRGGGSPARLEISDPAFATALDDMAAAVDRTGSVQRRARMKVAVLVIAAVISLAAVSLFALPAIATRLTPILPQALERRLGEAVDAQFRARFDSATPGLPLDCGVTETEQPGREALQTIVSRLQGTADLPVPLRASVVRRAESNAVALPGGRIYVFYGLVAQANTPDELAGVIAHEIGHVVRRDGMKAVLEAAGLSFLFGMLLGDFVGGGAIVVAARSVLQSSYSREAESAADAYAVALLNNIGVDANALGRILSRIADTHAGGPAILLEHPQTGDRLAAIQSMARPTSGKPLLDPAQWNALKHICAGR